MANSSMKNTVNTAPSLPKYDQLKSAKVNENRTRLASVAPR